MSILKNLRKVVKAIGLLDALLDEFEREALTKQSEKDRIRQIYEQASRLAGKSKT